MSRQGEDILFKCLAPGTEPLAGRFPGPTHARGKWFAIDIHCHVRCEKAAAMVEGNSDAFFMQLLQRLGSALIIESAILRDFNLNAFRRQLGLKQRVVNRL